MFINRLVESKIGDVNTHLIIISRFKISSGIYYIPALFDCVNMLLSAPEIYFIVN